MSPEQALDSHRADARADIYSLGCTLFYLLMGRPLYPGETLMQKILAHREEPIPSLRTLREDVPKELDAVFQKMVAKQLGDRYGSMHEVVAQLEACRNVKVQQPAETMSFRGGPTGGGDTEMQQPGVGAGGGGAGAEGLAIEDWLAVELPAPPTLLRPLPRRKIQVKREHIFIGSVAAGAVLLLVFLGIVLKFRTSEGTLVIEVNQPDAEVSVDDGKTTIKSPDDSQPLQVQVAQGKHTLLVKKGGFETYTKEFTIRSGGQETIRVELLTKKAGIAAETVKPVETATLEPPAATPAPLAATPGVTGVSPVDPQRRAAEAVLKLGGTVQVVTASFSSVGFVNLARLKDLPAEPFATCAVSLNGQGNVADASLQDLAGVYYLENLSLSGTSVTDSVMRRLSGVDIREIVLNDTAIGDDAVRRLSGRQDLLLVSVGRSGSSPLRITDVACTHLKQLPRLRYLALSGIDVSDRGLAELTNLRSLRELRIVPNGTAKGLTPLGTLPNLQSLTLYGNAGADQLIEVLPQFPQLRLVNLAWIGCPDAVALRLQTALPNATVFHPAVAAAESERQSLRWLLDIQAVTQGWFESVGNVTYRDIPQGAFSVAQVDMPESGPTSGAVNLRGLRAIGGLAWQNLRTADAEAEHLAALSTLRGLWLKGADISDAGIQQLTNLKQLEVLGIPVCQNITNRGLEHLTRLEHLYELNIGVTSVSDEGLSHVGRINGLQRLLLPFCTNLTSEGLKHLIGLPVLRFLDLNATPIDAAAVKHLKQMSCLRILNLCGTKVSASGIEELRRALPKCVIFWDGGAVIPGASAPGAEAPTSSADASSGNPPAPQGAEPVVIGKPVERAKPISVDIKPEPLELKPGEPLSRLTLVTNPPLLAGVRAWTIEPLGHRGCLLSLAYSPDGRLLASGADSGNILLWDTATETLLRTLVGHGSWVRSISFSPDGRYFASAGYFDGTLRFWDTNSGLLLRTHRLEPSIVASVAWSPDGRTVLAGSLWGSAESTGIRVYSLESGEAPRKVDEAKDVVCVAWAPDGQRFASASFGDRQVAIWGFPSLTVQQEIEVGAEPIWCALLAWSPDGRLLAHVAGDTLRIWDATTGRPWRALPSASDPSQLGQVAWSPDGETLAVGMGNSQIRRWALKTQTVVATPALPILAPAVPHVVSMRVLAYAPNGKTLATGDNNGAIHFYQDQTGWRTLAAHNEAVVASAFSPDGRTLAYLRGDGAVRLWQVNAGQSPQQFGRLDQNSTLAEFGALAEFGTLTWSADGRILAAVVNGLEAFVWDTVSGKRLGQFPAPSEYPPNGSGSILSPDGKGLATNVGKVRLYEAPSGTLAWEAEVGGKGVAWSPDGEFLAAGAGNDVIILNPQDGKTLKTLSGTSGPVSFIAWSRDGKAMAAKASHQPQLCIWEIASSRLLWELTDGVPQHGTALDWSPDGKTLICGPFEYTSLWDVESGKLLRQCANGNLGSSQSVSPDGRYFACVMDGVIRVCSLADGRVLRSLVSLRRGQDALISPDGHYSGPPGLEKRIVYVVQTDAGQETLTPEDFIKRYGWKNAPQKAAGPLSH